MPALAVPVRLPVALVLRVVLLLPRDGPRALQGRTELLAEALVAAPVLPLQEASQPLPHVPEPVFRPRRARRLRPVVARPVVIYLVMAGLPAREAREPLLDAVVLRRVPALALAVLLVAPVRELLAMPCTNPCPCVSPWPCSCACPCPCASPTLLRVGETGLGRCRPCRRCKITTTFPATSTHPHRAPPLSG